MGVWNLIRRDEPTVDSTREALREARRGDRGDANVVTRAVERFRDIGLDGKFTFASAGRIASRARSRHRRPEQAIARVVAQHQRGVAAGGFITGLGGFLTLPVALPLNVAEFYLQATRMVGAIAKLRGYDLDDDRVRTAVMLTLAGDESRDILQQAGLGAFSGHVSDALVGKLPAGTLMMINKGIGFRMLRQAGERSLAGFGKAVPALGGVVGAVIDVRQLRRIAAAARREFPEVIHVQ
ncbi:EcsC protein family protein [Raineyella antarctica]|uniref:EcsC protein family protein n=1 Tax=Raineyella antarctica TaxID=1577474 RepID=A0A1G6GGI5_9ACTN|nr:EcsC family protein [Raineyella antarctica]SDB80855.1 EcsC protein family protein [Raineyella antarctica]